MVLSFIIIAVVVAAVFLSTPNPQFFVTIHVYSASTEYTSLADLPSSELVPNATVTLSGPQSLGPETTPTGILAITNQIPGGTYTITAEKPGYVRSSTTFVVGADCPNKQVLTNGSIVCHALVRIIGQ